MLRVGLVREDEYVLHFDKSRLDERFGFISPDNEHYVISVSLLVTPRTDRRLLVASCACGNVISPECCGSSMSYSQMLSLAMLEGACPGTAFRETCPAHYPAVPDDCSSLVG